MNGIVRTAVVVAALSAGVVLKADSMPPIPRPGTGQAPAQDCSCITIIVQVLEALGVGV